MDKGLNHQGGQAPGAGWGPRGSRSAAQQETCHRGEDDYTCSHDIGMRCASVMRCASLAPMELCSALIPPAPHPSAPQRPHHHGVEGEAPGATACHEARAPDPVYTPPRHAPPA